MLDSREDGRADALSPCEAEQENVSAEDRVDTLSSAIAAPYGFRHPAPSRMQLASRSSALIAAMPLMPAASSRSLSEAVCSPVSCARQGPVSFSGAVSRSLQRHLIAMLERMGQDTSGGVGWALLCHSFPLPRLRRPPRGPCINSPAVEAPR